MEKIYIPSRKQCCTCGKYSNPKSKDWKPFNATGFKNKPQRFVFCSDCWTHWFGVSNQMGGGCPRKKIFKAIARSKR